MRRPLLIQGGMGMGVSNWTLARAVSRLGQLGVVSGTAMDTILVRRLQDGDAGGHMRRALERFPVPEIAERILRDFYIQGGKAPNESYRSAGLFTLKPPKAHLELCVAANFVEVFLAKEGHDGIVGINLLEKILLPNLPSLYGAMLAGVDYVLMGAGIPREIPAALEQLARHAPARLRFPVEGASSDEPYFFEFDPKTVVDRRLPELRRPLFFPIVASATLASMFAKKYRIDGFIVEGPLAGGHNAPPRGSLALNARQEPVYGPRDEVDLAQIRALGKPFWLGGSFATPERLAWARAQGAAGVQVGTAFAFCRESGIREDIKRSVFELAQNAEIDVLTDSLASPTAFPFKVVQIPGTISEKDIYAARRRVCDLGYLRVAYKRADGSLGYRCPAEPVDQYVRKGGREEETVGRKCLCNGLQATVGLAQRQQNNQIEPALVTSGEDLKEIGRFLKPGAHSYSAQDVVESIVKSESIPC